MSYALVVGGVIQSEGGLPASARRLDTGQWVMGLREYGTVAQQQACGYFEVVETARPVDTATHTTDRTVTLVAGVPTVTWVSRPKTQGELDAANEVALRSSPADRVALIETTLASLLEIKGRTNTTINGNAAVAIKDVVDDLLEVTRTVMRLLRLELGQLSSTSGT